MLFQKNLLNSLMGLSFLSSVYGAKIGKPTLENSPISVSNNALHLPFDYGLSLLTLIQNTGTKEMVINSVSEECGSQIKWFFQNLQNFTDDGMWALKMHIPLKHIHNVRFYSYAEDITEEYKKKYKGGIFTVYTMIQKCYVGVISISLSQKLLYLDIYTANTKHAQNFKVIDASTKIPAGILKLNLGDWMGSFDECLEIKSDKRNIKGNYCLGTMFITVSDPTDFVSDLLMPKKLFAEEKGNFQNAFPTAAYPSFGICIPSGCDVNDLQGVVKSLNLTFNVPFECQTIDEAYPPLNTRAWGVIGFFVVIILMMAASTAYDVYCQNNKIEPHHVLLISFSVYTNGRKLFKMNKQTADLSCLNGIRVLSMVWVIIGHTLSVTITGPIVNTLDVLEYLDTTKSMIFANAVHSVDTFLMITGLLVVYGYIKSKHMGVKFNLFVFYIHRYIRLTPPYLAVILVSMSLLQYMGSGPHYSFIVNYFQDFCQKNWWSALLYFQNYINVEQWCVGQTWYLNIDWQLYLCAPLFLLPLTWKPKVGLSLLSLALIAFLIVPFYVTWVNELPALITNLYGDLTNYQNLYYLKTHTRASSWFVGAFMGYIIAKIKLDSDWPIIKFNKAVLLIIWAIVLALINICIFMGHGDLRSKEYHKYSNAFYNSIVRPLWAACIGWIVFACTTGHGGIINKFLSLPIFQVLNRFTYAMYLLHVTMLYMIVFASKTPTYFSFFNVAYSFWGITMLTLALSVFWVLAFESPVLVIEKYLLDGYRTKKAEDKLQQPTA